MFAVVKLLPVLCFLQSPETQLLYVIVQIAYVKPLVNKRKVDLLFLSLLLQRKKNQISTNS